MAKESYLRASTCLSLAQISTFRPPAEFPGLRNGKNVQAKNGSSYLKVVSATFSLVCFLSLKESTWETRKNVFYFTSKALFVQMPKHKTRNIMTEKLGK